MSHPPRTLRTLRWKLTLSAAATMSIALSVVTIVVVVQLSIADQRLARRADLGPPLHIEATSFALQLQPILTGPDAAVEAEQWLAARDRFCNLGMVTEVFTPRTGLRQVLVPLASVVLTDASGAVLAGLPTATFALGSPLADQVPPAAEPVVRAALTGGGGAPRTEATPARAADSVFATAAIVDNGELAGLVYLHVNTGPLSLANLGARVLQMLRETVVRAAPVVVIVALILGRLSTRGLIRRLERLSRASAAWAGGDFSTRVDDPSGDELGALAHSLDEMAAQLATLIDARNKLAAFEERNVLARELHDRVKQNVFSVSMLLASVETLLDADPARAKASLALAREAAQETGRELVALIDQVRPDAFQAIGLAAALRTYAESWSRSQGIRTDVSVAAGYRLTDPGAHSLFLVAREALANVARHSRADRVEVDLELEALAPACAEGSGRISVRLSVRDNGIGFDRDRVDGNTGFGLHSMASRVAALGGRLDVDSRRGSGTTIVAACVVPVDRRPSEASDSGRAA